MSSYELNVEGKLVLNPSGSNTVEFNANPSFGVDATLATWRSSLGLAIGTDVQAQSAKLQDIADLTAGAPQDDYVISWDNTAGEFVLRADATTAYTAGDGLQLVGTEFSVDLITDGGLGINAGQMGVLTGAGLELDAGEVQVALGDGVETDGSDNLAVKVKANGGLEVDADGVDAKLKTSGGLAVDGANGLEVSLGDGLQISGTDAVEVLAGTGIAVSGTGVAIDTAVVVDVDSTQTLENKTLSAPDVAEELTFLSGSTGKVGVSASHHTSITGASTEDIYDNAMSDDSAVFLKGKLVCLDATAGEVNAYEFSALAFRGSGVATSVIKQKNINNLHEDNTAWSMDIVADTTAGGFKVEVTGSGGASISATLFIDECVNA